MSSDPLNTEATRRLDEINTQWSLLRLSHEDSVSSAGPARKALVLRYSGAIRSYVGALMKNDQDADEVAQEAVVRLLKGDFAAATPERGRFRDLLKVAVRNMVRTYWRNQQRRASAALEVDQLPGDQSEENERDAAWLATWQQSVLDMTWNALEAYQRSTPGAVAYTLMRLRVEYPDDSSDKLAERLSEATGKTFQAAARRQQLRRARLRFAQLLVEELARGLADASPERIEEELSDLGLMTYVGDFLPDDWRETGRLCESTA